MKLHLPKVLLTAIVSLMSAAAYGTTSANIADVADTIKPKPGETINSAEANDASDKTKVFIPIYAGTDVDAIKLYATATDALYSRPVVFDSSSEEDSKITIEGWGTAEAPVTLKAGLYVRDGELTIKNSELISGIKETGIVECFHVSGNNATLIFDNSRFIIKGDRVDNIGGRDGAGKVSLQNGSIMQFTTWLGIGGAHRGSSKNNYTVATAVSPENTSKYNEGVFTERSGESYHNGVSHLKYGTGTLEVLSGSKLYNECGIQAMSANILISGEGSELSTGRDGLPSEVATSQVDYTGYENVNDTLARGAHSTTTVIIEKGGVWNSGNSLFTCYNDSFETKVYMVVDGEGSQLNVGQILGIGYGGWQKWDWSGTLGSTELHITNGGSVSSQFITFGPQNDTFSFKENNKTYTTTGLRKGANPVYVYIDALSSMNATETIYINDAYNRTEILAKAIKEGKALDYEVNIVNEGSITAKKLIANGGTLTNSGSIKVTDGTTLTSAAAGMVGAPASKAVLVMKETGTLSDEGAVVVKSGATLRIEEGGVRTAAPITLGSAGSCSFESGATVELFLTSNYLDKLTESSNDVSILVANKEATTIDADIVGADLGRFWEFDSETALQWNSSNGETTITGKVNAITTIWTQGETIAEKITDVSDEHKRDVVVTGDTVISGENSYSGGTEVNGGELAVGSDKALGTGKVSLKAAGALNLGSQAVANDIEAAGGVLRGADQYLGNLVVSEDLTIEGSATAKSITMLNKAGIVLQSAATYSRRSTPAASQVSTDAMYVRTEGDGSFTGSLTLNEGGLIELNNGNSLVVTGTLTLGNGTKLVLNGDYAAGDTLVSATESLTLGDVTLVYDNNAVVMEQQGNSLVLVGNFKQEEATASTLSNWGIATASRAVVNAVRGQRSNTGCIFNGKGTAWVASLGSKHDINGSDINISGAAVGADMQVGRNSRIGIALGYAEGEVQPTGLRQVDQEGSYLVVYGEHGLKKLSATSCLSMDWVAAYGTTDSEVGGLKWEQDSLQLNSRVNWNKKVNDKLCMNVFGGLEYFANNSDTVEGVKTGSIQNLRGEIGVGARYVAWGTPAVTDGKSGLVLAQGCEKLVLNGEVRYMNDMVRSNPVIRMNGLSGTGENPGRQGIGIEAGATYRIGERWSASANYGFNTMEDSKEHRLNIGAAYTF